MFAQKKVTLPPGRHKIVILDEADRCAEKNADFLAIHCFFGGRIHGLWVRFPFLFAVQRHAQSGPVVPWKDQTPPAWSKQNPSICAHAFTAA
eukprot:1145829-Pelagomonas_calceolata.AAC.1